MTTAIDEMKARSRTIANTTVQQVNGGFLVTGQIQFVDKETNGVLGEQNDRCVAATATEAYAKALNWTNGGSFDVVQPVQVLADFASPTIPATI